jgi:UDP-glucose 4-epimerase
MRILIIGSKGFIGAHALKHFKKQGHEVWGSDVMVDYTSEQYCLIDSTNANFHSIFENLELDVCINCSGAASVPDSLNHPLRDYTLNTVNVFKILDAIRQYQPACKFINLSSAAVYGNPSVLPIKETSNLHPLSPYGWHKLQAEQICQEFYSFYKMPTCSLRIFSAYGEGLKKQLFWDLAQKAQLDGSIKLYGTGEESRDFIHVSDLIKAIEIIIFKSKFIGEKINVANGKEITIKDIVKCFYSNWDKKIDYSFSGEERKGDPNNWVAEIEILKSMGYIPQMGIEEGLKKYYEWIIKIEKE